MHMSLTVPVLPCPHREIEGLDLVVRPLSHPLGVCTGVCATARLLKASAAA